MVGTSSISVVPGEVWNTTAQKYFLTLEDGINQFPGFSWIIANTAIAIFFARRQ